MSLFDNSSKDYAVARVRKWKEQRQIAEIRLPKITGKQRAWGPITYRLSQAVKDP